MRPFLIVLLLASSARAEDAIQFPDGSSLRIEVTVEGKSPDVAWAAFLDKLFDWFDHDGDGTLSKAESARVFPLPLADGREAKPDATKEWTRDRFREHLRSAGFTPVSSRIVKPAPEVMRLGDAITRLIDRDGDGKLSAEELRRIPDLLRRCDENEDEVLTASELLAAVETKPVPPAGLKLATAKDAPSLRLTITSKALIALDLSRLTVSGGSVSLSPSTNSSVIGGTRGYYTAQFHGIAGDKPSAKAAFEDDPAAQSLATLFDSADRDGDGKLTMKDLEAYFDLIESGISSQISTAIEDRGRNLFDRIDTDANGSLDATELTRAARELPEQLVVGIPASYRLGVTLGTSSPTFGSVPLAVTARKPQPAPAKHVATVPRWFIAMDRNGDGSVSSAEFLGGPQLFLKFDANRDERISVGEADAALGLVQPPSHALEKTPRVEKKKYDFKDAGKEMEYALFVPSGYDKSKKSPLVIALHGLGGNPQQFMRTRGLTEHAEKRGYIVAAPMGFNEKGWYGVRGLKGPRMEPENLGELSEKDVMNVLALVKKEYSVDPERVYLMGHSMGGGGTWHLGIKHAEEWAALAPIAPAIFGRDPKDLEKIKGTPVILVQGDKDNLVPVAGARRWAEQMKKLEMTHEYIEVAGGTHGSVVAENVPKIFEFFDTHKRTAKKTMPDYRPVVGWPQLPSGLELGAVSAVATDSKDRVFVAHRAAKPILVFDREGKLLRAWGDDHIKTPHGLRIDSERNVWVTDIGNHLVMKFDPDGKLLLSLGRKGEAGAKPDQFDRPTDVAITPTGEFYVTDGYGNSRVMKFSRDGKLLKQWGTKGKGEGEFNLPHAICLDAKGNLYVGDRENDRVQVFDADGKFLKQWNETGAPYGLFLAGDRLFVADGRAGWVRVLGPDGKTIGRWGEKGTMPGQFQMPHMLCVDSRGDVYVAEVTNKRIQKFTARKE